MMKRSSHIIKRIFALVLSVCFISSCAVIPVPVFGAGVASVNGAEYSTLAEAFDAANTGDTIILNADVTLDSQIVVTKNVILSASGPFRITRSSALSASPFTIEVGATLTVSGVTFNGGSNVMSNAFIGVDGGTLNVKDGVSFTGCYSSGQGGAVRVNSGVCVLSGGSFSGNSASSGSAIYVGANASALRMAGSVSFGSGDSIYLSSGKYIDITGALAGSGSIPVQSANESEGTRIALIGSTLAEDQLARFAVETSSGVKTVTLEGDSVVIGVARVVSSKVARVGDKEFDSLEDAVASVSGGSAVIELCGDTEVKSEIVIKNADITIIGDGSHTISRASSLKVGYIFSVSSGASLTIGGSGDAVTISGASVSATMPAIYCGGSVNLAAGAVITANKNVNPNLFYQGTMFVPEGGSLALNGASISSNTNIAGAVMVYGGSFTMNSGSISGNAADNGGGVYVRSGSFTMNGGAISGNTASANGGAVYCAGNFKLSGTAAIPGGAASENDIYLAGGRSINIRAGWNPGANIAALTPADTAEGTKIVYFSEASETKTEYFILTGDLASKSKLRARDNYLFIGPLTDEIYVAYIGEAPYVSLTEAVNAVPANGTATVITIVSDITLTGTVIVPEGKNIVFTTGLDPVGTDSTYASRTVKRDAAFDGAFFAIAANSNIQIAPATGKQLIFDGSGVSASNSVFVVQGTLEIRDGTVVRGNSVKKNENLTASDPIFGQGGAVIVGSTGIFNMHGGSLEGNYAAKGGAVFVNDGIFNLYGGTISGNSALYGGAVMIFNAVTSDNVTQTDTQTAKHGYMTMTGGTVTGNTAAVNSSLKYANGQGGAVYIGNAATFEASGGTVTKNKAGTGAGIYVGTIREKGEKALRIPVFLISGSFAIAADNDVHLALVNESIVTVTGALSGINRSSAMTITLPNLLAQNTALVEYRVDSYSDEQNTVAASGAVNTGVFKLGGDAADYYTVAQSTADPVVLLNTIDAEAYLTYESGRSYNGVPVYEEIPAESDDEDEEAKTEKNRLVYEPITITPDGCITASFEMSYYVNLYSNIHTQLVGRLPVGTKITLVDSSDAEKPSYYYYEVTGKETVREITEDDTSSDSTAKILDIYEIPLSDFLSMGQDKVYYDEFTDEEAPSTDKKEILTERFTFVIDFSEAEIEEETEFEGEYTLAWEHNYPGETEGSYHNISENFAAVEYTVAEQAASELILESSEDGVKISYKLDEAGRVSSVGRGLIMLESANDEFPAGTVVTVDGVVYPVSGDSGKIAISLPLTKSGELETEGTLELEISNYYGSAILETTVRAVLYASYDGYHISVGADYDAESEGITYSLEAEDSWAISVTGADGKKPSYEYENAANAETLLMNVNALCNSESADTVSLTLQDSKDDYAEIPLSVLFVGYDETDSEGVLIPVGSCTMKIRQDAPNGEYRMAFTAGDKTEYVKVKIRK